MKRPLLELSESNKDNADGLDFREAADEGDEVVDHEWSLRICVSLFLDITGYEESKAHPTDLLVSEEVIRAVLANHHIDAVDWNADVAESVQLRGHQKDLLEPAGD